MTLTIALALATMTSLPSAAALPHDRPDGIENIAWIPITPPQDGSTGTLQEGTVDKEKQEDRDDTSWVEITIEGDVRRIRANGLPNHATGRFPNRGNPNSISAQTYDFRIPLEPTEASTPTPVGMNMFGIALNGCFFEAGTAEWWRNDRNSGWHIEAIGPRGGHLGLDDSNGHVQPSGAYHYHAVPDGLVRIIQPDASARLPMLVGWAADGYPIYGPWGHEDPMDLESPIKRLEPSWQFKEGTRPGSPEGPGGRYDGTYEEDFRFVEGSGDLDRMNGRFGHTKEFPEGTYYYVVTDSFPFVSRSWKGTPSPDMSKRRGPPGGRQGDGRGRGRGRGAGEGRNPNGPPPGRPPRRGGRPGQAPDRPTSPTGDD